jgi:hypothetical protein
MVANWKNSYSAVASWKLKLTSSGPTGNNRYLVVANWMKEFQRSQLEDTDLQVADWKKKVARWKIHFFR